MYGDLSLSTALGAMRIVARSDYVQLLQIMGISEDDMKLVSGKVVWTQHERPRVRQVLDQLACGVLDVVGVERFEMPAEYLAAVIAVFVDPTNTMVACRVFENMRPAEEVLGNVPSGHPVQARVLFVLVAKLYGDRTGHETKQTFQKVINKSMASNRMEVDDGKKGKDGSATAPRR